MQTSYKKEDVTLLLKDITGLVTPLPAEEREKLIQQGRHYSEMLPIEYVPTEKYMQIYHQTLKQFAGAVADSVAVLAEKVAVRRGMDVVLVSLARAGIPIGILLKHYLERYYGIDAPHYSISIIRGRGIDDNAMQYLLRRYAPNQLLFVDGWIGKGAILRELQQDIAAYHGVLPEIAVLSDPADMVEFCGTHEDILIPSSCLNCTVSGLISRTFLREDVIGKNDFHGAVYYGEYQDSDLSYQFIEAIEREFPEKKSEIRNHKKNNEEMQKSDEKEETQYLKKNDEEMRESNAKNKPIIEEESGKNIQKCAKTTGLQEVEKIAAEFKVSDINLIKPGIGETTRVLLRRVPWRVLVDERYRSAPELEHLLQLAKEKNVPVRFYPMTHYKACGIIRKMADT